MIFFLFIILDNMCIIIIIIYKTLANFLKMHFKLTASQTRAKLPLTITKLVHSLPGEESSHGVESIFVRVLRYVYVRGTCQSHISVEHQLSVMEWLFSL